MAAYLDLVGFKAQAAIPSEFVDEVEAVQPGWTLVQLTTLSDRIDSQLKKRYAVPFDAASPPLTVCFWLEALVVERLLLRRGVDATDAQVAQYFALAEKAREEIQKAADSETGLYELPLRADASDATGVSKGGSLGYCEASPYTWRHNQHADAEDDELR